MTTPEPEAGIAEVARRLPPAQRTALRTGKANSGVVAGRLARAGLVSRYIWQPDEGHYHLGTTPLGEKVRQHLARAQGED